MLNSSPNHDGRLHTVLTFALLIVLIVCATVLLAAARIKAEEWKEMILVSLTVTGFLLVPSPLQRYGSPAFPVPLPPSPALPPSGLPPSARTGG